MKRIILVGMPASGKTKHGELLSENLNFPYFDTDRLIIEKLKMPITEIFSKYGANYFRILETQIIRGFTFPNEVIISTGGGLPCFYDNMTFLNNLGSTIFLKTPIDEIVTRVTEDKGRPLLTKNHDQVLQDQYLWRLPIYQKALFQIEMSNDIEKNLELLLEAIKNNP